MPKVAQVKTSNKPDFIVFKYKNERVLAKRETCYRSAVFSCQTQFPDIPKDSKITFHTKELETCENVMTRIAADVWEDVVLQLKSVTVVAEAQTSLPSSTAREMDDPKQSSRINVFFRVAGGGIFTFIGNPDTRIHSMLSAVCNKIGQDPKDVRVLFAGRQLDPEETLTEARLKDDATVHLIFPLTGGKPVIYLFSPTSLKASVKLRLAPQWNLSAIYPVVPIKPKTQTSFEEVSWSVQVHPSGELTELTTSTDIAYLFWEAETDSTIPPSPPPSPVPGESTKQVEVFNPNDAVLNDNDSVVLPVSTVTPYLDKSLAALGLHTEARTSFITYWLPAMLKHQNVAFRFVPQESYEHAAPLAVSPVPDVITRIFMIFQAVTDEELLNWPLAVAKAAEPDVSFWRNVVGVDSERTQNNTLFRVLEWGGMEVVRSSSLSIGAQPTLKIED